jgi:hypothetical protein
VLEIDIENTLQLTTALYDCPIQTLDADSRHPVRRQYSSHGL